MSSGGPAQEPARTDGQPPPDPTGWLARFAGASPAIWFLVTAVGFAAVTWPLELAVRSSTSAGSVALRAVLFGGAMTWFLWRQRQRQRHRPGHPDQAVGTAVRSGDLPSDADLQVWRPALAAQRRQLTRARRTVPVVFGSFAVLAVVLALVEGGGGLLWWAIAAGFVLLVLVSLVLVPRQLERLARLDAELDRRPDPPVPG